MRSNPTTQPGAEPGRTILDRWGLPAALIWGYVAVAVFMIGDGVESNYLAPYLSRTGLSLDDAASIISFYGIAVTIGSWLAGTLSTLLGPRRVMIAGGMIWVVLEAVFLALALPSGSFGFIALAYGARGIAYPMFAYAFLVWIQAAAPPDQRGSATGWFWLTFTAGLPTLGSAVAIVAIPALGEFGTFWLSLGIVLCGFLLGTFAIRERTGYAPLLDIAHRDQSVPRILMGGIDILARRPRVAIAGIVRIINTTPYFGFFIFLPGFFVNKIGFTQTRYLTLVTIMGLVGMSFNPVIGYLSDRVGWRRILTFVGGLGSAISMLLMYYVPQWTHGNFVLCVAFACLFGTTLCGYVPAAALIASLCEARDKGNALAIYCFSAGLSTFIGPALFRVLNHIMGTDGVVWVYAALYLVSAALSWLFLIAPDDPGEQWRNTATSTIADRIGTFSPSPAADRS